MKKFTAILLTSILLFILTSCGVNLGKLASITGAGGSDKTQSGQNNTPKDNDEESYIDEITIPPDTSSSIEEAVGKTLTGKRFVTRKLDISKVAFKPEGATSYYVSYEFDADGFLDTGTSLLWYGFDDEAAYKAALNNYIDNNSAYFLKRYNDKAFYYTFYTIPAVRDLDGDEKVSFEEVMRDFEDFSVNEEIVQ